MSKYEGSPYKRISSKQILDNIAILWFLVTVIGQLMFVVYIFSFYGRSVLHGDLCHWNEVLAHGYIPNDDVGNIVVILHILLAVIITLGGPIQLIPQVRTRFGRFHRWNGRFYMITAILISIDGLYMVLTRGTAGGAVGHVSVSISAVLILLFVFFGWRCAIQHDFNQHRRWVLRLFMVVSSGWLFRVGLMFWVLITGGVGIDWESFTGPFLTVWNFGQYVLPLAVLELFFYAQSQSGKKTKFIVANMIFVLTLAMGAGIYTALIKMWIPRILI